jgi:hypothetical protein
MDERLPSRRIIGPPNPNKANILKHQRGFESSRPHLSAEGRNALARNHTANRNAHVLDLLLGLSAMASVSRNRDAPSQLRRFELATVSCEKAIGQSYQYPHPDQGAHFLPGQLLLNGRPPWGFLTREPARIFLKDLFFDVERLHYTFNQADSAAESGPSGLRVLFAECARHIIRDPTIGPGGRANRQFAWNLYKGVWLPGLARSLVVALDNKLSKPQVPALQYAAPTFSPGDPSSFDSRLITNLEEIGNADDSAWNNEQAVAILQGYLDNASAGPSGAVVRQVAERADAAIVGHEVAIETFDP